MKDHSLPLEKMFAEVFPNYGNIVSASIPVGMDMALNSGKLQRGSKVVFCPASAGMVYSAVQFVF
jgi:3-oxoacyl-[acyl-carrier-protein] synthase III